MSKRGAGDVPVEPGSRADEQVAVRHADASGGHIRENQHEEERMRDIHIGRRGPEAANEEQPDKLKKTLRFGQEASSSSAAASSDPYVALEYPASGETQSRFVTNSGKALESFFEEHAQEVWERNWILRC